MRNTSNKPMLNSDMHREVLIGKLNVTREDLILFSSFQHFFVGSFLFVTFKLGIDRTRYVYSYFRSVTTAATLIHKHLPRFLFECVFWLWIILFTFRFHSYTNIVSLISHNHLCNTINNVIRVHRRTININEMKQL